MTRPAPIHPRRQGSVRTSVLLLVLACLLLPAAARAAEVIPPPPARYFNDYANLVSPSVADELNQRLVQFDRDTSNQIVVAIYPKMQSDSDIADYTFRVKETWHVGQKGKNNGAVLFVFVEGQKIFIQTNYGLEGALPDATCKQIIDEGITPLFKRGDYANGLRAGINAILGATKAEYQGTGGGGNNPNTTRQAAAILAFLQSYLIWIVSGVGIFLLIGVLLFMIHNFGGTFYQRHRRSLTFAENVYMFFLNFGLTIISEGNSSSSSGSRGGFSGGGGTGGGGGAGGSW